MKSFVALLVGVTLVNCSQPSIVCPKVKVSAASYYSDAHCWTSTAGDFQALVVLSESSSGYMPTFISLSCRNIENGEDEILSLSEYRTPILYNGSTLNEVQFTDLGKPILSNFVDHKPSLEGADKVLFIRARVDFLQHNSVKEVRFSKIIELNNTGNTLAEILSYRSSC